MSDKRYRDNEKNSPYKRGIVVERKPGAVKVNFGDEDDDQSFWLNVAQKGGSENKSFEMPDIGTQVACLVDWDGEDGVIIGAIFSEKDGAPTNVNDDIHMVFASGLTLIIGKASGDVSIAGANDVSLQSNTLTVDATNITMNGNIETFGELKNNGKFVGSTHGHKGVTPGNGVSDEPA